MYTLIIIFLNLNTKRFPVWASRSYIPQVTLYEKESLRIMFAVGLSYIAFIMLRYVPSIPAYSILTHIYGI